MTSNQDGDKSRETHKGEISGGPAMAVSCEKAKGDAVRLLRVDLSTSCYRCLM